VCHLAGIKNGQLRVYPDIEVDKTRLDALIDRLNDGEPLQYIIGNWDFYDSEFYVGEGVLIPRPETEELVEKAIARISKLGRCTAYDLCAGSGCIGLSIAKACPLCEVYLIEKSGKAFEYLYKNAEGISNAHILNADICDDLDLPSADIIVSNPPYIKSGDIPSLQSEVLREPVMALDGGADGLDFYRIINRLYYNRLNDGGTLLLEIGNEQGSDIPAVLTNFKDIKIYDDIYGNARIAEAIK
jgi:release factor glutamine methyltransferase